MPAERPPTFLRQPVSGRSVGDQWAFNIGKLSSLNIRKASAHPNM